MSFTPQYVNIEGAASIPGGSAIVIDVLRAYTTAAWAFALGTDRIILSNDTEQALALKARIPGALALKDSRPYDGFDLTNSPIELQAHDLTGRTIVQRTTAGTVGAVTAKRANYLYCAGFLNAAATAEAIMMTGADEAYFVITGEGGTADEDQACAEYIAALVQHLGLNPEASYAPVDPSPYLQRLTDSNAARLMAERVANGVPGVHADDVKAAMDLNRFDFTMQAREEHLDDAGTVLVLRAYNQRDDWAESR